MSELSLRLKIAGREYPMKVAAEEEENVRKAAKLVNDKVKGFRKQFGIDDIQDLLAMVAFDGMIKVLAEDAPQIEDAEKLLDEMNEKIKAQLES